MPSILSISSYAPPYRLSQETTLELAKELFYDSFPDIERVLPVFQNGQIESRHFSVPIEWFGVEHTFQEKNDTYIASAIQFGVEAINNCLAHPYFLTQKIEHQHIDAIFFISSSGISTPSIEARIMNRLPFSAHTKRVPIWGLGCAGGAAGLSRAHEYCLAFPASMVLVVSIELCSLTFQKSDKTKSNLVGASLFADGVACALVVGDEIEVSQWTAQESLPYILDTQSTLMPDSEDVMGWEVKNDGLHVIFSKDIPSIIEEWLKPNVLHFLSRHNIELEHISHFIAHPGGKKVIEAYQKSLGLGAHMTHISLNVLKEYGNMSSATVFFVLEECLKGHSAPAEYGLLTALGPGFSSELLLLEWR